MYTRLHYHEVAQQANALLGSSVYNDQSRITQSTLPGQKKKKGKSCHLDLNKQILKSLGLDHYRSE